MRMMTILNRLLSHRRDACLPSTASLLSLVCLFAVGGCVLAPRGAKDERARLDETGQAYETAYDKRDLPELPARPGWRELLERAFLANGDLEAGYFEWKAAMQRVDMASAWPNSNVELGFEYMFSDEQMKSWDRTTITAGFDSSMSLSLPIKTAQSGKVALADARAAGLRFEQLKFELQRDVLDAWWDYVAMAERVRIEEDNVALLRILTSTAEARLQAGGRQQDLLTAQVQHRLAENELEKMRSELVSMRAMLNAMVARAPDAELLPPQSMPEPRELPLDDARIIAVAVDRNQELAALAQQVQGRRDALALAQMQWLPDVRPMAGLTGSVERFIGAMVMLPTAVPMIQASIEEARAMLSAQEAMLRQGRYERGAEVIAALALSHDAERQARLFEDEVLPRARQVLDSARQTYAAGSLSFLELIEAQRTLLDVRRMIVQARATREKALAELECLICVDLETLAAASTQPATQPADGRP